MSILDISKQASEIMINRTEWDNQITISSSELVDRNIQNLKILVATAKKS